MCSLEEAWGDLLPTNNNNLEKFANNSNKINNNNRVVQQQLTLENERQNERQNERHNKRHNERQNDNRQQLQSRYPQPDVVGQPVTQADDRRQYAQPEQELMYPDFVDGLMKKPSPEMNNMTIKPIWIAVPRLTKHCHMIKMVRQR